MQLSARFPQRVEHITYVFLCTLLHKYHNASGIYGAVEIIEGLILEREIKFKEQTNYLFGGKTGKPIQVNSFNTSLKKANESLGKNKINKTISSHIFRHSHISLLAELNVPVKAIMERVGHVGTETTLKIYTHVTKKAKTNLVKALNKYGK